MTTVNIMKEFPRNWKKNLGRSIGGIFLAQWISIDGYYHIVIMAVSVLREQEQREGWLGNHINNIRVALY
jgi:hypothetical protein